MTAPTDPLKKDAADQPLVSVAMIVRDAESLIEQTLTSITGLADEVVVLDTGSTDATEQRAAQGGARVVRAPWRDDFSEARNRCLAEARGRWVLWLDAGEHFRDETAAQLRRFIEQQAEEKTAYMMLVRSVPPEGPEQTEQVARVRLVPNVAGVGFTGRVCERIKASLATAGIAVEGIDFPIYRDADDQAPERRLRRAKRNFELARREIQEIGPDATMFNCLGEALQILNEKERALAAFQQAVATAPDGSADQLNGYYGWLAVLDGPQPEQRRQQMAVGLQALERFPQDAQLLCAMGGYLQILGHADLSLRTYQTAWEHGRVHPEVWHIQRIEETTALCYAASLRLQQRDREARRVLEWTWRQMPDSVRLRRELLNIYVKLQLTDEALELVDQTVRPRQGRAELRAAVRGATLAARGSWLPAQSHLEAAFNAGCREPLCLRWLTATLVSLGNRDKAGAIIQEWRKSEPNNPEVEQWLRRLDPRAETEFTAGRPPGRVLRVDRSETGTPEPIFREESVPTKKNV